MEYYNVDENVNRRGIQRVRETEDDHQESSQRENPGGQATGKGQSKGKGDGTGQGKEGSGERNPNRSRRRKKHRINWLETFLGPIAQVQDDSISL